MMFASSAAVARAGEVLHTRQRATSDLWGRADDHLQHSPVLCQGPSVPRCDAVTQDALYGSSGRLLSLLYRHRGVGSPGQIVRNQESRRVDPFHTDPVDVELGRICSALPKVQDKFFCLCGVQLESVD